MVIFFNGIINPLTDTNDRNGNLNDFNKKTGTINPGKWSMNFENDVASDSARTVDNMSMGPADQSYEVQMPQLGKKYPFPNGPGA